MLKNLGLLTLGMVGLSVGLAIVSSIALEVFYLSANPEVKA